MIESYLYNRYTKFLEDHIQSTNKLKQTYLNNMTLCIQENESESQLEPFLLEINPPKFENSLLDMLNDTLPEKILDEEKKALREKIISEEISIEKNIFSQGNYDVSDIKKSNPKKKKKTGKKMKKKKFSNISISELDMSHISKSSPQVNEHTIIFDYSEINKSQLDESKLEQSSFILDQNWIANNKILNDSITLSPVNPINRNEIAELKPKKI